ncbi:MAG: HAMP domain-containing protein [Acidobacteriia bacterium]|nr:HAMP domain-containing protein [Terriglobia bacterium]
MPRLTHSLAIKLTACVVGGMALLFGLYGYWNLRLWRQSQQEIIFQDADRISDTVRRSIRYSMLRNQREEVFHIINTIGHENGISRIRIFSKEGQISFSTDEKEVGQFVDKKAEACYACHAQAQPLTRLDRPDRMRIYTARDGTRVLGLIRPIENEADCSNAACHAHSGGSQVLGVLDTNVSLAAADLTVAQHQGQLVIFTAAAILIVSLFSTWLIWMTVHKPVRRLTEGTRHVAQGDLDYLLPETGRDEISSLAVSFNHMTQELKKARAENLQWTQTLEDRVQQKTGELERAYRSLMQSEKMASLGRLAAVVAHEINNPLAGILTYSKLLSRMADKGFSENQRLSEAKSYLHIIEGESRRCGGIVKNLLTFARQTPINPQKNDLNEIVERCLLLVGHQMTLQNIELEKRLELHLPPLYCDAGQVQQALLVILMNAVEAMLQGGRLSVESAYDPARRLGRVVVTDEGPGIPSGVLSHIFEPFFSTKSEEGRGTGLGLAIALGIVQQHGGNIEVVSTPQKGTAFTVLLPEEPPLSSVATGAPGSPAGAA